MSNQLDRRREISRILVDARKRAASLARFPGALPGSLEDAYKVQAISRTEWPDKIVGWKVGGVPPHHREALGADFLSGPVFSRRLVHHTAGKRSQMPVFAEGFAAIEPEFVLELGETRGDDRLFIGAEIASSPIVDINGIGPIAVVCDFGNNNGVLVGPEIQGWQDLGGQSFEVATWIEGDCVGRKTVTDLPGHVGAARDFLFELAEREEFDVSAGVLISTGAITGVHDAVAGDQSMLDFGQLGSLDLELVPEQPLA